MKVKAFIHITQHDWNKSPTISVYPCDMTNYGHELLEVREIDVAIPDGFSAQALKLRQLAKEKEKVIEQFHKTIAAIEDQVKKYQSLEMTV